MAYFTAMNARNISVFLLAIVALSVSYYFGVALPGIQRQRLDFEKQKYATEQKQRADELAAKQLAAQKTADDLKECLMDAQQRFDSFIQLNSTKVAGKPGVYSTPTMLSQSAYKNRETDDLECHRLYNPQ